MTLQIRGVVYDVALTPFPGRDSRPHFSPAPTWIATWGVIAEDLHCNAVRLVGADLDRLEAAAVRAQSYGLAVWLSPLRHDTTPSEHLDHLAAHFAARA